MTRREALGLILLGALLAAGRMIRRGLLMGPSGAWRDPLLLSSLIPSSPAIEEAPPPPQPPFAINLVGADTLVHLPGVGPVLAARILDTREQEGPFRSPADLRKVKGIGPKLSERLAPLLLFHTRPIQPAETTSSPGDTCR